MISFGDFVCHVDKGIVLILLMWYNSEMNDNQSIWDVIGDLGDIVFRFAVILWLIIGLGYLGLIIMGLLLSK